MAPEIQEDQARYSKSVDIWSLGIILFELSAGYDYQMELFESHENLSFPSFFSVFLKSLLRQMIAP